MSPADSLEEKEVNIAETKLFSESDLVEELIRRSGPGGQHRNTTMSGVRLTHVPTGIVVMATEERKQSQNRRVARERLAEKLRELNTPVVPRVETKPTRNSKDKRIKQKVRRSQVKKLRTIRKEDL